MNEWKKDEDFIAWIMEEQEYTREEVLGLHCGMEDSYTAWLAGRAKERARAEELRYERNTSDEALGLAREVLGDEDLPFLDDGVRKLKAHRDRLATAADILLAELDLIVWRDVGTVVAERVVPAIDGLRSAVAGEGDSQSTEMPDSGRKITGETELDDNMLCNEGVVHVVGNKVWTGPDDMFVEMVRCGIKLRTKGDGTGRDYIWKATATVFDNDGREIDRVEAEGDTAQHAVAMCVRLYDEITKTHASEPK